jgi:hypothetical protein
MFISPQVYLGGNPENKFRGLQKKDKGKEKAELKK